MAAVPTATKVGAADKVVARPKAKECGVGLSDWCPSYRGDRCNRHRNSETCRADPKCFGMPYRGESLMPCLFDERGFASNCPTVGCSSLPPNRRSPR
jgi:hypothetical protein